MVKIAVNMNKMILSNLTIDEWFGLAIRIDHEYNSYRDFFIVERIKGYYYLKTTSCDWCSFIKVYCEVGELGYTSIKRLGPDTEGWKEVHLLTYYSVNNYLNETIKSTAGSGR